MQSTMVDQLKMSLLTDIYGGQAHHFIFG